VVAVDVETHTVVGIGVYYVIGCHAAKGFGQGHRGTAVQNAEGLYRSIVYRHGGPQKGIAYFGKLNTDVLDHSTLASLLGVGGRKGFIPD
jgi:hypothetical protein